MKVHRPARADSGSTLMVALVLAIVIMIALEGLLSYLTSEYRLVHRTYSYENAIYLAEAGVEEGVAMVNHGDGNWGVNGWSSLATTNYTKTVNNFTPATSSSILGNYTVNVYGPTNSNPVLICTGIVDTTYASIAGYNNTNLSRAVRVVLGKRAIFQWGMLSQNRINLNGNNISIDSFDSSDPNASNYDSGKGYGTYDSSKRKDNGDVASNGGITNTISVGNADIYGHASTGEGGVVSVGPTGFIAALGQAQVGVMDSSRVSHSMSVDLPVPTLPTDWNASNVATPYTISSGVSLAGGSSSPVDYLVNSISLSGSDTLTISSGYVRLYVTGDIGVTGNATVKVIEGAKVEIYVVGTTLIAGNGVANENHLASNFQLYGLGSSSVSVSGNGELSGVIYAPSADVTFHGGGSSGDVSGAVVGKTVTLGGQTTFHYDESLKKSGPSRGYSIVSWQEL